MKPLEGQTVVPDETYFRPDLIVTDTVYAPRETETLRLAKKADVIPGRCCFPLMDRKTYADRPYERSIRYQI